MFIFACCVVCFFRKIVSGDAKMGEQRSIPFPPSDDPPPPPPEVAEVVHFRSFLPRVYYFYYYFMLCSHVWGSITYPAAYGSQLPRKDRFAPQQVPHGGNRDRRHDSYPNNAFEDLTPSDPVSSPYETTTKHSSAYKNSRPPPLSKQDYSKPQAQMISRSKLR